jgi:hypothetical protein
MGKEMGEKGDKDFADEIEWEGGGYGTKKQGK